MTPESKEPSPKPKNSKTSKYKPTSKETLRRLSIQEAAQYRVFLAEELSKLEEVLKELVPMPSPQDLRHFNSTTAVPERTLPNPNYFTNSPSKSNASAETIPNVEFSLATPMDPDNTEAALLEDIQNLYDYPNSGAGSQLHSDSLGFEYSEDRTSSSNSDSFGYGDLPS